ncbi:hypothetical protein LCGC14_1081320 [marine sediment metagenome]|uniref:Uncharacterized protein n=1 Tax=marine sediment metagenome TaxID=412755 RepID=A0A0F9MJZ8_9ZZZZ
MKIRRVSFGWEVKGYKQKYYAVGMFHRAKDYKKERIFGGRRLLKQIWRYLKWRLNI